NPLHRPRGGVSLSDSLDPVRRRVRTSAPSSSAHPPTGLAVKARPLEGSDPGEDFHNSPAMGWLLWHRSSTIWMYLFIPDAFLFPRTFLRIWRTSSVRSRTVFLVLKCTEMPAMTTWHAPCPKANRSAR